MPFTIASPAIELLMDTTTILQEIVVRMSARACPAVHHPELGPVPRRVLAEGIGPLDYSDWDHSESSISLRSAQVPCWIWPRWRHSSGRCCLARLLLPFKLRVGTGHRHVDYILDSGSTVAGKCPPAYPARMPPCPRPFRIQQRCVSSRSTTASGRRWTEGGVIRCRAGSAPHPRAQPLRGCPTGRSPRPAARSAVAAKDSL